MKHARTSRGKLRVLQVASALCIIAGSVLGGWLAWFYVHSSIEGSALLSRAQAQIAAQHDTPRARSSSADVAASCTPSPGTVGELVIPSLSLVAPVVEGDGNAQLSDAVGHVPTSVWPGGDGTAVFAAHDVTWFHEIDHLTRGDRIDYVSGCDAYTYEVESAAVVAKGAPVLDTPGHLVLVTCWPLDALWFTTTRFLVHAVEVGGVRSARPVTIPTAPRVPPLAVPTSLASVDTLANNATPLGALVIDGKPSRTFEQSPGALDDAAAVQDLFFAAQRAAEANNPREWSTIAPHLRRQASSALSGAIVTAFPEPLRTTLIVSAAHLVGGRVVVEEQLSNEGTWTITCDEGLVHGKLAVTGWVMSG